jgi:UDP-N-acetylglucosamine acyltransferase
MATVIHPTAIVDRGAELGVDVEIGPYCLVSSGTRLGDGTKLISHVSTMGRVWMGAQNKVYPFSVIGAPPQDLSYKNEDTEVVIGDRNHLRESVTVHRGTYKDRKVTTVGNDNYIMVGCHIAHDCIVGNSNIMANGTALAGHVQVGNFVNIGGQTGVVQKVRIGDLAFIGAGTILRKDLPPYLCAKGFSEVTGPNLVGMKRRGMSEENIRVACELYKIYYKGAQTAGKSLQEMEERFRGNEFAFEFIEFLRETKVGVQR